MIIDPLTIKIPHIHGLLPSPLMPTEIDNNVEEKFFFVFLSFDEIEDRIWRKIDKTIEN